MPVGHLHPPWEPPVIGLHVQPRVRRRPRVPHGLALCITPSRARLAVLHSPFGLDTAGRDGADGKLDTMHKRMTRRGALAWSALVGLFFVSSTALAAGRERSRYVAFGGGRHWLLVDVYAKKGRPLTLPDGVSAEELTVTPDGRHVAFTARPADRASDTIYLWEPATGAAPAPIDTDGGRYANPAFSPDGTWLYFVHNLLPARGPGMHGERNYAQLYRRRVSGGALEPLTEDTGCKMQPTPGPGDTVLLVHNSCRESRSLILAHLGSGRRDTLVPMGPEQLSQPVLSPDGKAVLLTYEGQNTLTVMEQVLATGTRRPLFTLPRVTHGLQARYGVTRSEIFYLREGQLWLHRGGKSVPVQPLVPSSESPATP